MAISVLSVNSRNEIWKKIKNKTNNESWNIFSLASRYRKTLELIANLLLFITKRLTPKKTIETKVRTLNISTKKLSVLECTICLSVAIVYISLIVRYIYIIKAIATQE